MCVCVCVYGFVRKQNSDVQLSFKVRGYHHGNSVPDRPNTIYIVGTWYFTSSTSALQLHAPLSVFSLSFLPTFFVVVVLIVHLFHNCSGNRSLPDSRHCYHRRSQSSGVVRSTNKYLGKCNSFFFPRNAKKLFFWIEIFPTQTFLSSTLSG